MPKFTEKQQKFIENKAAGMPTSRAALNAGYAENSVSVTAAKLLRRPDIQAAINRARVGRVQNPAEAAVPNAEMKERYESSLEFMFDVMNDKTASFAVRFEAAKALLPYQHARIGEKGKKELQRESAQDIARTGRFSPKKPPRLN